MINLNDPLAVLATRLPWSQIETAVAAKFEHQNRVGQVLQSEDMFENRFNVSDEELVVRWSENILWQYFSAMDYYKHGPSSSTLPARKYLI